MELIAPQVIAATLSERREFGADRTVWQYHSRSDHHSKVACWAALVDLIASSSLLASHLSSKRIVIGVNHTMRDFETSRKKDLDLVVARPDDLGAATETTLVDLAARWSIVLPANVATQIASMPPVLVGPVGSSVLVALEAKVAMTAHSKARPRLHDELDSSHLTVHGASDRALAVGFVLVNASEKFLSPGKNLAGAEAVWNHHKQPQDAERVIEKLREIRRRTQPGQKGFDGLGALVVSLANDGSPVEIVHGAPAPQPGDVLNYASMISRVANEYDTRFASI